MGMLTAVLCDYNLIPLPTTEGPITNIKSATLILEQMDQFVPDQAEIGADTRRALLTMAPFTAIRWDEQGIGTVKYSIIHDPSQQIRDNGDTITISPPNITDQLAQYSTGLGAAYQTSLGDIVSSLGNTTPTGETLTLRNTTDGTVIAYIQYAGRIVICYHPSGIFACLFPGPVSATSIPLVTDTGTTAGFAAVTSTGITVANALGTIIGTYSPTNEVTGWSAAMLDDGPNVVSAAPVAWTSTSNVTITGNSLRKNAGTTSAFDGVAVAYQAVVPLAGGARSDASLSWQAPNTSSQYVMGLADPTSTSHFAVRHGFWIQQFTTQHDAQNNPLGVWNVWESGALATTGTYGSGATFQVSFDYTSGVAVAKYYVNTVLVYVSGATVNLPLQPMNVTALPNSEADNAILTRTVLPSQQWWSARWDQASPVEALLDLATATHNHVRQGVDSYGVPNRTLELGQFGIDSGIRLVGALAGNVNAITENPQLRLVESLTWTPESSKIINTVTPLGASTGDQQVDLKRCWQIVNDPFYPGYGKFGNVLGSIFPEYDAVNYPIKVRTTRDGNFEYYVRDTASYATLGFEVRGKYTDSQFQYVDSTAANQELTARALYVAVTSKLKWESKVHHTLSVVVTGGRFRPPRAGSRVTMDYRKIGQDTRGNFTIMNTAAKAELATPYVMQWARNYGSNGDTHDTVTLSNLGFHPDSTNQRSSAASLKQLEAVTITPTNSTDTFVISDQGDVDANGAADHSLITDVFVGPEVFRVKRVSIAVQFKYFRQQVQTASGGAHVHEVAIPDHDHAPPAGLATESAAITKEFPHVHEVAVLGNDTGAPTATDGWLNLFQSGSNWLFGRANTSSSVKVRTNTDIILVDLAPTAHPHPILGADVGGVKKIADIHSFGTITTVETTEAGAHTHTILAALNDVSQPALATLSIDSGDGNLVDRTSALVDVKSNTVGPWTNSFFIYDASKFIFAPGKTSRVQVKSLATTQNTTGLGAFKTVIYVQTEIGGLGQRIFAG